MGDERRFRQSGAVSSRDERLANEAELIARAKCDPQAFAPLYAHYVGPIFRYCALRLETREAAEDATSQIFSKVLQALPNYDDRSFRSWLFRSRTTRCSTPIVDNAPTNP